MRSFPNMGKLAMIFVNDKKKMNHVIKVDRGIFNRSIIHFRFKWIAFNSGDCSGPKASC